MSYRHLLPLMIVAAVFISGCAEESAPMPQESVQTQQARSDPRQRIGAPMPQEQTQPKEVQIQPKRETPVTADLQAVMVTNKGTIRLTLFASKTPLTVANFVNLAQRGFYDGLTFHRVMDNFMIQGGCPLGTGRGSPGYRFADECVPDLRHDQPGRLSMANAGPGTNGSQFFITHVPTPHLDGKHTIFGEVQGPADQGVVNAIAIGDKIERVEIEGDTTALTEKMGEQIAAWNKILDEKFPRRR